MEFALVLPFVCMCIGVMLTTVMICLETLRLNDTARVIARAVATSDQPELTAQNMVLHTSTTATVSTDLSTQVLTVHLAKKIHFSLLGVSLPGMFVHATSHIAAESPPLFPEK